MPQKAINLFQIPIERIFQQVKERFPKYEYDFKKHCVLLNNNGRELIGQIRLPLHLKIDHLLDIIDDKALVIYISIESGSAAICIMEGRLNSYHTTFSAYMSRKKQGFSQIKYLNKKGKSKAGSRVRLASTVDFFESINHKLSELFEANDFNRIALNCNATLIPYLFQSKIACPFSKKDTRLYKIPLHITQSNFTNLNAVIKKMTAPMLLYAENENPFLIE